jgi:hypothetical protein
MLPGQNVTSSTLWGYSLWAETEKFGQNTPCSPGNKLLLIFAKKAKPMCDSSKVKEVGLFPQQSAIQSLILEAYFGYILS